MGIGDELLAAGHAQRVYDADPSKKVAICDQRGQVRWHDVWAGNPIIATPAEAASKPVHRITNGSNCRPYITYPFTNTTGWNYNTAWKARDHVGKLYLTNSELDKGQNLNVPRPFVMIEPSICHKSTSNKAWPVERYAAVVKACPDVTFVQPIHADSKPLPGAYQVKTATFREACGILAASVGYIGIEGAFHHAAKVLNKPAVVIVGGAINWDVLGYPDQVGIVDDGPGSPCGSWRPCAHCAKALDRITVERVVGALRMMMLAPAEAVA